MSETVGAAREDLLRTVAAGTAGLVGAAFLQRLVQSVGETFGAGVCWISELVERRPVARALACWPAHALPAGEEYALEGTPSLLLRERAVVSYASGVLAAFPDDTFLLEHGLDGYLAVTCPGNDGAPIGYLAVTTERALEASPDELAALQIFAARIGAELERRKQEDRLHERESALRASRAKVLEAGDEERRRIGRNLHDGAQQRLIALGQFLDVARRRLDGGDPAEAGRLLALAREQVKEAGDELRALAQGLHPVVLDRGLPTALTTLGMQSPLTLEVYSLPDRRLPDAVEATIFYVVAEALSNAVKHAGASRCELDVSLADGSCAPPSPTTARAAPTRTRHRAARAARARRGAERDPRPSRARRASGRRSRSRSRSCRGARRASRSSSSATRATAAAASACSPECSTARPARR